MAMVLRLIETESLRTTEHGSVFLSLLAPGEPLTTSWESLQSEQPTGAVFGTLGVMVMIRIHKDYTLNISEYEYVWFNMI